MELANHEKARLARERVVRGLRRRGAGQVIEVKTGNLFELRAMAAAVVRAGERRELANGATGDRRRMKRAAVTKS